MYISFWNGLWVPKSTSDDVIARINAAVVDTLADPTVRARLTDLGHVIATRKEPTPQALAVFHKAEIENGWRSSRRQTSSRSENESFSTVGVRRRRAMASGP